MSYNPYEKSISQIIIRRPYDARADAEHYIANLKRMDAGKVPPAIGVKITQKDPRMMLKIIEARAENPSLEEELRNESARLANEIKRSLEENIMIMLTEVGVDANALKYTAELNRELQKEVEKWKDLYGRMNVENGELQTENARLRALVYRLQGEGRGSGCPPTEILLWPS